MLSPWLELFCNAAYSGSPKSLAKFAVALVTRCAGFVIVVQRTESTVPCDSKRILLTMTVQTLKRRNGTIVTKAAIDAFATEFSGQVLLSDHPGYDGARRIWNASIDKHPGMIARCSNAADVVAAVKFARTQDLLVAIRSGGHSLAGRSLCDDGLVIDLAAMRAVSVNPDDRTVRAEAGALLADLDRETHAHGLAVPAGVMSTTGIAGLTLGGGVGWLARKYGLTCDNLLSCELVTAEGELVTADAGTNADLFWGLRGGGGNFGVATSFLYRAHPVSEVLGALIAYPRDHASRVLRAYRNLMPSAPAELTIYAGLISLPDGTPAVALLCCYCGVVAEGERALKPFRSLGASIFESIQWMPFPAMQQMADQNNPDGMYNYMRSTFLEDFSDEVIELLVKHGDGMSPRSLIIVQFFGGEVTKIHPDDTAFAQRQAKFNVAIEAKWVKPEDNDKHITWTRCLSDALAPFSSNTYMLNFLADEGHDKVRQAFGSNYERLVDLKTRYDPNNFFSLNQNIVPRNTAR
jgi:FAD binding domain/Berberine and berberine like